jgi:hypothetical protein
MQYETPTHNQIVNNTFINSGTAAIRVDNVSRRCLIANNLIYNPGRYGNPFTPFVGLSLWAGFTSDTVQNNVIYSPRSQTTVILNQEEWGGGNTFRTVAHLNAFNGTNGNVITGNTAFVLTPAQRGGNFSGLSRQLVDPTTRAPFTGNQIPAGAINPITAKLLPLIPISNSPDGFIVFDRPRKDHENQFMGRLDYNRDKQRMFGRYFYSKYVRDPVAATDLERAGGGTEWFNQSVSFGHTYSFTPALLNEFRTGFTRQRNYYFPELIGSDILHGGLVDGADHFLAQLAAKTLIGNAGFQKTVAQHDLPLLQRGADDAAHVLCARRGT